MGCFGGFGGNNSCLWIILLLIIICCCCGNDDNARLGGSCKAHYVTGLAMIVNDMRFCEEVPENEFLLVSEPNPNRFHTGNPLDVVAIDPATGSYHNTLPDSAFKNAAWTFERACRRFVCSAMGINL